jgi:hypothetical protein
MIILEKLAVYTFRNHPDDRDNKLLHYADNYIPTTRRRIP